MVRLIKIIVLLFLGLHIYAQKSSFKVSRNGQKSFYGKKIVSFINEELKHYTRAKSDTAFVEINDSPENTFFDAFITVKRRKQSVYYYIFYNPHIDYYIIELNPKLMPTINVNNIKEKLTDTSFVKEDTTTYVHGKSTCHFYFGIDKADKELSVWSTIFLKSNDDTFAYKEIVNTLYSYFSSAEPRGIKPAIMKKYRQVRVK